MTTPNCLLLQTMRQVLLRNSVAPPRLEIISPYTNTTASEEPQANTQVIYTQKQLDMRRKYEILQYKNNGAVIGKRTKKATYSGLMSNPTRTAVTVTNSDGSTTTFSTIGCPDDETLIVPTTSSDVPGPKEMIYYEKDVPLYMYGYNVVDYAILPKNVDENRIAEIISECDIVLAYDRFTELMTVIFQQNSSGPQQSATINIPFAIRYIGETLNQDIDITITDVAIQFRIGNLPQNIPYQAIISKNNFINGGNSEITITIPRINTTPGNVFSIYLRPYIQARGVDLSQIEFLVNPCDDTSNFNIVFN